MNRAMRATHAPVIRRSEINEVRFALGGETPKADNCPLKNVASDATTDVIAERALNYRSKKNRVPKDPFHES
jgi:hypothetical protein